MKTSGFFKALNMSASGLAYQRRKLDAIAENIANVNTTRTAEGGPYRRKVVISKLNKRVGFRDVLRNTGMHMAVSDSRHIRKGNRTLLSTGDDLRVESQVVQDKTPFRKIYDPSHPDADGEGYVLLPNVNPLTEMVDLISASRGYEANLTVVEGFKKMAREALDI